MKLKWLERIRLLKKIKEDLSIDTLYEACRVISLNETTKDTNLFRHTLAGRNHILETGSLENSDKTPRLKLQISIFTNIPESVDYNIKVNLLKRFKNEAISYDILFINKIDKDYIVKGSTESIMNYDAITELIRITLKATILEMKRWY